MTTSIEDYLKGIYLLKENNKLNNKNLAEHLKISAASVSEMIKKLAKEGYIIIENKDIILTEKGNRLAVEVIRKHRIWEVFLVQVLNFKKDDIHEEAEKLEHATSWKVLQKLEKFLSYPKESPHGKPIIYDNEYLKLEDIVKLSEVEINDKIVIFKIKNDADLENYLKDMHINIKDIYEVKKIDPFNGPIYLKNNSDTKAVALDAAKLIDIYKIV